MPNPKLTRSLGLFLVLAVALVLSGACSKKRLVIDEDVVAAWMPINNKFALDHHYGEESNEGEATAVDEHDEKDYWNGVLIQIGSYKPPEDQPKWVVFEVDGDPVQYALDDFWWINVVSERAGYEEPLTLDQAKALLPGTGAATFCDQENAVADTAVLCTSPPCNADDLVKLDAPCLRRQSLHGFFTPTDVLTFWQGPEGYEVTADMKPGDNAHNRYFFTLKDKFRVDIDGTTKYAYGQVDRITITAEEVVKHGSHMDPPWGFEDKP